eukprot:2461538-Pyramimonas_sp.AAC.1
MVGVLSGRSSNADDCLLGGDATQPVSGAMPKARAAHSATLVGSRMFVFGGESQVYAHVCAVIGSCTGYIPIPVLRLAP